MDVLEGIDSIEAGRRLGHDFFHLSGSHPQPNWPACVREGFDAAAGQRTRRQQADRFQRKWLQLRLGAWTRGRAVAADVTVQLLRTLDVTHCPVTREALTHGALADSDWSIDRLHNDGAYAASNLAVLSTRANRAKGRLGFDDVLALSRRAEVTHGLSGTEWLRLAVLMMGPCFTSRTDRAPTLPLCAPLPACSVRVALQQIQRLLTVHCPRTSGKNGLVRGLRQACHSAATQQRLRQLADVVHDRLKLLTAAQTCWDVWLDPKVMSALVAWREGLDAREWSEAAAISGYLAGGRRVTQHSLKTWHLPTRGYAPSSAQTPGCTPVVPRQPRLAMPAGIAAPR